MIKQCCKSKKAKKKKSFFPNLWVLKGLKHTCRVWCPLDLLNNRHQQCVEYAAYGTINVQIKKNESIHFRIHSQHYFLVLESNR